MFRRNLHSRPAAGPARLRLGKDVEPGTHLVTLEAKGMFGARCFVTVDAP